MVRISIYGLGYVGVVSACCLADQGHSVIGVDPNQTKVDLINQGRPPIIEKDIAQLIEKSVGQGKLKATTDPHEGVINSDVSLICVGTPSQSNGALDLKYIRRVSEQIGSAVRDKDDFHVIVYRSTMLPGTIKNVIIPILEKNSGKKAGEGFGLCNNPEFLREGSAVYDFYNPPKTVIGELNKKSGDVVEQLYRKIDAPLIRTDVMSAEMVKYADNVWHALKIDFANEIGSICKAVGIDGHTVMDIFCMDTKLNLSSYYMKPGFAFGGSCLPKDVRALVYKGKTLDLDLPILNSIIPSNSRQIERGLEMIMSPGAKKIGVLGFSFKSGTDDLRESPLVEIIERLLGKGYDIRIYDRNVNLAKLMGANKDYILNHIPHISKLMVEDISTILEHSEIIVIGNGSDEFREALANLRSNHKVIDLVRIVDEIDMENYDGICW